MFWLYRKSAAIITSFNLNWAKGDQPKGTNSAPSSPRPLVMNNGSGKTWPSNERQQRQRLPSGRWYPSWAGSWMLPSRRKKIDFLGILPPRRKTLEKDERKNKEQKKKEEENGTGPILLPSGMSTFMAFHWLWLWLRAGMGRVRGRDGDFSGCALPRGAIHSRRRSRDNSS